MIPQDEDFILHYELKHPRLKKIPTFRFYELPVMGIGPKGHPLIEIDRHIDTSDFPNIYRELQNNYKILRLHIKGLVVNGIVPKELNHGFKSIDSILLNPQKYIGFDYENDIKDLPTLSRIKSYFYEKFNLPEAWQGICHLRTYTNFANKSLPSSWLDYAHHFPKLKSFVEGLPFKSLGYAVFFISNGNRKDAAFIHRDTYHRSHARSNFINIIFDQKPRPFFVYDAIERKKIYVNPNSSMYYFNEADLHGVDPEPEPRLMLRVEGVFTDVFAEKIGLKKTEAGFESFDWSYAKPSAYLAQTGQLEIYKDTDI
jgi:hypothetical protein